MIRGAPLAAAVPLQNIYADGESNHLVSVSAPDPVEIELTPGYWAVTCPVRFKMQVNTSPGQGIGDHPVVRFDRQWRPVYVPVGELRYVVAVPYFSYTSIIIANKIDGIP